MLFSGNCTHINHAKVSSFQNTKGSGTRCNYVFTDNIIQLGKQQENVIKTLEESFSNTTETEEV